MSSQCASCACWQAKGGLIEARRYQCTAVLNSSSLGRVSLLIAAIAQDYASRGQCPMHECLDQFPDSYRSIDLVDQLSDGRSTSEAPQKEAHQQG